MIRLLRLLRIQIWRSSLEAWSWRSFLITITVGQAITPLLGLLVWSAALPGNNKVSTYYVAVLMVSLLTVSQENHTLSNSIYLGGFAGNLLMPQPVVLGFLGSNLAFRFWHTVFGLPLVVLGAFLAGVTFRPMDLLVALPALLLAMALRFVFTYGVALSALWTERAHAMVGFGDTLIFLLGGSAAPLAFLPEPWRSAGRWLPFWGMLGMPAEIASQTGSGPAYAIQVGWLIVLLGLVFGIWRLGLRRFTSVGG
jgi:ABC-2 type transport system permease protein